MKYNYLLIGPRSLKGNFEGTGGIVVLFEDLLRYCDDNSINYLVIDTNKFNYSSRSIAYISILFQILMNTNKVENVSLHGTANDYLLIAPFLLFVSKIFRKRLSLRKFAGNFIDIYKNYNLPAKLIINLTLKYSDTNFFETKYLVNYFKKFNNRTYWFPNVRKKQSITTSSSFEKRFLFLGAVKPEKGIDILCEVSKFFSKEYTFDIYGNLDEKYINLNFEKYNINYKGSIKPENVLRMLSFYDVLILPSYREGYPGVIIEALSVGLPIIATNLEGIKEMLNDKMSILIEPKNVLELKNAIEFFNSTNYESFSLKALDQFKYFDTDIQTKLFFERLLK